ncbi:MAG: exodeoxyribonuclease VII small subunit [Bacteroidales bacterium]|nr:exodeoxyribonuclease VII small subunit [Bacteroidales bacterium]MDD2612682.1 exodeoxyribonuclease VII small subunit [Bacteroidales bacterium]MDD3907164.1 exodeoxyribonuclease VII small subunit [Bacteroidales bacterium]MDD4712536.1 exodeoxyribonuclease VII small subunit [Bacteroidales bacterium]
MAEKKFSYNAAMQEVEQILASLEKNNLDVDEMSQKVKRAAELLQACKQKLYQADAEIQAVFENVKI